MNRIDKIKEIIENNKKSEVSPMDLINPNTEWASEEKSTSRFEICKSCPELIKLTTQCKKCGCIMKAKTKLEKASCPIGKW
jgi:peptide deformylase